MTDIQNIPEWMNSLDSILRAARLYETLPALIEANNGHAVTATAAGDIVQDCCGKIFMAPGCQCGTGDIIERLIRCGVHPGIVKHEWMVRFRILRLASPSEVSELLRFCSKPFDVGQGPWYEVHTD